MASMDYLAVVRLHNVWRLMKVRCENTKSPQYKDYGGRGIYICTEWQDFNEFCQWALDHGGGLSGLHLDRENNDGPYSPENCRFVTPLQNARNKRNNRLITAFGETKNLSAWIEDDRCLVTDYTLRRRLDAGWDVEEAMTIKRARDRQSRTCSNGHQMTEENTYRRSNGFRMCKICTKARAKEAYDRNKTS